MKKIPLILVFILIVHSSNGQLPTKAYFDYIKQADSLYKAKNFPASAKAYSEAFKANDWNTDWPNKYNAACSWALAGIPDSAFYYLNQIAHDSKYSDYNELNDDEDFLTLHEDTRWTTLINELKIKNDLADAKVNKALSRQLDSIYDLDQKYRLMLDEYQRRYGAKSEEMKDLIKTMHETDSTNLIFVTDILDKQGWLGAEYVGVRGNTALFLVIQHADLKTQEKYLPMMKEAVKKGNARGSSLALLIDRIEMRNGRPQIYGSQITMEGGKYTIYQIIDEPNVNARRAEVGLEPLENYVKNWNIEYTLPKK